MAKNALRMVISLGILVAILAAPLFGGEVGDRVFKWGEFEEDLYLAGERITVSAQVKGDVIAAGGVVEIDGEVGGDVIAAGGQVEIDEVVRGDVLAVGGEIEIKAEVADDVRVAGGTLSLEAHIGGDLIAAAGQVMLDSNADVAGHARLAGGEIIIRGPIGKTLEVAGGKISLSGIVRGNAKLWGGEINIAPTARIGGNLTYESPEKAIIHPEARIAGQVTYIQAEPLKPISWVVVWFIAVVILISVFVTAVILFIAFPRFSTRAARTLFSNPWKSLFLGFALVFSIPAAAIFLMITVIGAPLGIMIKLLYLIALGLAFLTTALFLGDLAALFPARGQEAPLGRRIVFLFMAVLLLLLLGLIPYLGGLVLFAAIVFGFGALALESWRVYTGAGQPGN